MWKDSTFSRTQVWIHGSRLLTTQSALRECWTSSVLDVKQGLQESHLSVVAERNISNESSWSRYSNFHVCFVTSGRSEREQLLSVLLI